MGFIPIFAGSCARQDSKRSEETQSYDLAPNEGAFSCEDNLKTISYIERVHLREVDSVSHLKRALQKILKKGKIPTPYFTKNPDSENSIGYEIHYVTFNLPDVEKEKPMEAMIEAFDQKDKLCRTVELISEKITPYLHSAPGLGDPDITTLLHKSVLRYFIAGLDPHSYVLEYLEYRYLTEGYRESVQRDEDDNFFTIYYSKANPYYSYDKEVTIWGDEFSKDPSMLRIEIFNFNENTTRDFKQIYLKHYENKALSELVIDLRRNRGGDAFVVAELADLFIKNGITLCLQEKTAEGWRSHFKYASSGNELPGVEGLPIIILMSRYSASSSETFAAAMQDHQKGIIVGERSFGKGTGQRNSLLRELPIPGGVSASSLLSLTQFYTYSPQGRPIQLNGVEPDIPVIDQEYVSALQGVDFPNYNRHYEKAFAYSLPAPDSIETLFIKEEEVGQWDNFKSHLTQYFDSERRVFTLHGLQTALSH